MYSCLSNQFINFLFVRVYLLMKIFEKDFFREKINLDEYDSGRGDFGRGDFGRVLNWTSTKLDEY